TASRDTLVSGNNLSANVGAGILVEPSGGGSTLRDNSITGSAQGIFSYDAITIMNNTVFGNTNGIDVAGAGSAVVLNRVSGSTGRGIMVEIQGNVWVANNNVSGNGQGIQLYQTTSNTIMGNVVTNNRDGIFSGSGTSYNTIDNNTVTGNEYGITLDLSTGETILRNEVSGNRQGGITVGFSALPVIRDNHVAGNARSGSYGGIYLESTTGARVFHNAIVGNTIQAHDAGTNSWDDGYPTGGNYWSDYTGVDNCSGPNQNTCPSPDGIGDTPYSFPASSRDRYPLMASPTTQPTPPSVPWNVRAVPSDRAVALTWSAPLDDGGSSITNYRIYGGTASGSEAFLIQLGNVTTYAVGGLSNGVTYYYQVSAKNAVGDGPRSSEVSATPATTPGPPSNPQATPGVQRITLSWSPPADNGGSAVAGYRIWRGTATGGEVFLVNAGNVLTYLDASVSVGTTYYYQVSAVNAVGDGARSTEAQATPASPANQPPRCGVMTPASGDRVSGTYPVTGTSNDPDGSVTRVEVRVDGGTWQNATGTNPWRYDWDTRQAASGAHTIHARSFDGTTYSSVVDVDVTVDNGLPPPQSGFGEGWFWGLLGLLVLVSALLVFVLLRERRTKRPPEPRP
ncbi:MAG TPA: right-handed parallel beta-helix repeat-containing protein, partial [Thermoplasmata archaeon]|nr:right-handed parallel beta-helix repeat-containing protein [Thermoplasmata archaeon]